MPLIALILSVLASVTYGTVSKVKEELSQIQHDIDRDPFSAKSEPVFASIEALSKVRVKGTWKLTDAAIKTAEDISNLADVSGRLSASFNEALHRAFEKFEQCVSAVGGPTCLDKVTTTRSLRGYRIDIAKISRLLNQLNEETKAAMAKFWFFQRVFDTYKKLKAAQEASRLLSKLVDNESNLATSAIKGMGSLFALQSKALSRHLKHGHKQVGDDAELLNLEKVFRPQGDAHHRDLVSIVTETAATALLNSVFRSHN